MAIFDALILTRFLNDNERLNASEARSTYLLLIMVDNIDYAYPTVVSRCIDAYCGDIYLLAVMILVTHDVNCSLY
jgi:hypothetical protein